MDLFSPKIWTVGSSHPILDELLVIGPYPSPEFFRKILKQLQPRNLTLVFDGACESGILDGIRKLLPINKPPQIRFAWCNGIVHAKVYYLRWKQQETASCHCKLIWGSLNASQNGFEKNAETLSHVTLPLREPNPFIDYFRKFQQLNGKVEQMSINIANCVTLVLPGFNFTSDRIPPHEASFESWVQSGFLCHSYERDSSFLRFRIKLKKPLPQDFVKAQLKNVGVIRERDNPETLSYRYIPRPEVKDPTEEVPTVANWRWRYFLDTRLGFWTSGECYQSQNRLFKAKGATERDADVADLKMLDLGKWYTAISEKLYIVSRRLQDTGRDPGEYFWLGPNRGTAEKPQHYIDAGKYHPELKRQAIKDKQRVANEAFLNRFVMGYEFFPVPDLRNSEAESQKFLLSLCQSILDALNAGKRSTNLLVQVLAKSLRNLGEELERMDAPTFLSAISGHWKEISAEVRAFHEEVK